MHKAAESKARRDEAGGDKAYKLLQKARKAAARLARDENPDSDKEKYYPADYTETYKRPNPNQESKSSDFAPFVQSSRQHVPNAYAID